MARAVVEVAHVRVIKIAHALLAHRGAVFFLFTGTVPGGVRRAWAGAGAPWEGAPCAAARCLRCACSRGRLGLSGLWRDVERRAFVH